MRDKGHDNGRKEARHRYLVIEKEMECWRIKGSEVEVAKL